MIGRRVSSLSALEEGSSLTEENDDCIDKRFKCDDRLFPEFPLYIEGMRKPGGRGVLHFLGACLLPFGFYHLYYESHGYLPAILSGFFYLFTNLWCYGVSGLFHTFTWSKSTEILLQKLDHCGIALLSCGTFVPVSVLLLEQPWGFLLTFLTASTCAWACYNIFAGSPSVFRQAIVPACFFPFLPLAYMRMTSLEYFCCISTIVCQILGISVFVNHRPDPLPNWFGYHEIFHLFVTTAGVLVYICNWSIIHRMSNPTGDHSSDIYFVYFDTGILEGVR